MARERKLYDPEKAARWTPRKQWVELTDGSEVCVWELSVPETFQVAESAQRHPQDPRPGQNEREAALWLVALAARRDDTEGSPRIWGDMDVGKLFSINPHDFTRLLAAARFMLSLGDETEENLADFTAPTPAATGPRSRSGASNNSAGSPAS